jgi:HPt (histidine-containing phosphotransfer) domain-containing protein
MAELADKGARIGADVAPDAAVTAPPLAPAAAPAIDRAHLARMTHGERDLEREVLQLYATQAGLLLDRMLRRVEDHARATAVGALAHTLTGSSRGIGAWQVADAAAAIEADAAQGRDIAAALARLASAIRAAQAEIVELTRG